MGAEVRRYREPRPAHRRGAEAHSPAIIDFEEHARMMRRETVAYGLKLWLRRRDELGSAVLLPPDFLASRSFWAAAAQPYLEGATGTWAARRYAALGYRRAQDLIDNLRWYHDEWETIVLEALWNMNELEVG